MFSARLPATLRPTAFARAIEAHRASGRRLFDLTEANPTRVDLPYPEALFRPLGDAALAYRPDPRGAIVARRAVAATYDGPGRTVDASRVVLTAGTSDAYAWLFKLLCDPGSRVLVPQPGYPLFDLLTRLDGIEAVPYRLDWHGRWSIDRASVERELTPDTRAMLIVSPHNPTGSMVSAADRRWLIDLARTHDVALIADEVFADYRLAPGVEPVRVGGDDRALTFSLGGLSKACGLPHAKLAWIVVDGPDDLAEQALERLDLIADTYLSVSTPVQEAAPALIVAGRAIRAAIAARVERNLDRLRELVANCPPVTLLEPEGGWSAVLQVPATEPEEALVLRLLERADVVVHPGYFFDFVREAFLVLSLLPEPGVFDDGVGRTLAAVGEAPA